MRVPSRSTITATFLFLMTHVWSSCAGMHLAISSSEDFLHRLRLASSTKAEMLVSSRLSRRDPRALILSLRTRTGPDFSREEDDSGTSDRKRVGEGTGV